MLQDMRASCQLAADCLTAVGEMIRPWDRDERDRRVRPRVHRLARRLPVPAQLQGLSEERLHQRQRLRLPRHPGDQVLKDGDIVNVDVTTYLPKEHGYHGDTSVTFYVGEPSERPSWSSKPPAAASSSASPR